MSKVYDILSYFSIHDNGVTMDCRSKLGSTLYNKTLDFAHLERFGRFYRIIYKLTNNGRLNLHQDYISYSEPCDTKTNDSIIYLYCDMSNPHDTIKEWNKLSKDNLLVESDGYLILKEPIQ